jgi:hypothetical protein
MSLGDGHGKNTLAMAARALSVLSTTTITASVER